MSQYTCVVINAGTMTGVAVLTSVGVKTKECRSVSFDATWTGTPTGNFSFEYSNSPASNVADVPSASWHALTVPTAFAGGDPVGAAGSFGFGFDPYEYAWIRIKYTNSASTGVLTVTAHVKGRHA